MENEYALVGRRAWDWLVAHRDEFRLPGPEEPQRLSLLKPIVELGLTTDLLVERDAGIGPSVGAGRTLLAFGWDELGQGQLLHELLIADPGSITLAPIYAPFRRWGFRDEMLEEALGRIAGAPQTAQLALQAWQALELAVTLDELGLEGPWSVGVAYEATWRIETAGAPDVEIAAQYALAHAVFYMTGHGRFPSALPEEHREALAGWLPLWSSRAVESGNIDLLAELVMATRCIGEDGARGTGQVLVDAQSADGMVGAPPERIGRLQPGLDAPRRRRFLDNYHTTVVTTLACAFSCASAHGGTQSGDTQEVLRKKALLRLLSRREAARLSIVVEDRELEEAADRFRQAAGLLTVADFARWFAAAGVSEEEWLGYLQDAAVAARLDGHHDEVVTSLSDAHDRVTSARRWHSGQRGPRVGDQPVDGA